MPPKRASPKKVKLSVASIERVLSQEAVALRASMLDSVTPEDHGGVNRHDRLSFGAIDAAISKDPMVYGGLYKKSQDMVKKWCHFESSDPNESDPDAAIVAQLEAFSRRVNLRGHTQQAVYDVVAYGDAYTEIVMDGDAGNAESPLAGKRISELARIVPETLSPVREKSPASADKGRVKFWRQQSGGNVLKLHPSRVEALQFVPFGDDARGLGAIEAAIRTIVGKEKGDNAAGDQLAWYAKGFHVLTISDATTEELELAWKELRAAKKKGSNEFVGSDRHKYEVHSAAVVNPQPFYDEFHYNLASALGMPKDVLIGASAGAITGSETNLRDYYEALDATLQTKLTPWLERLFARELGVAVEDLPVRVVWNPLYVNEETEAKTRFTGAQAASIAFRDRIITGNEYRKMAFQLDPLEGLDELPEESFAFPGFSGDSPPEQNPADELKRLAGDNA